MMMFRKYLLSNVCRAPDDPAAAAAGAAAAAAAAAAAQPFYSEWKLDGDGTKFLQDRAVADPAGLVKIARDMDRLARDRNVVPKPDPKSDKFGDWEGHELLGWVKDETKYQLKKPEKLPDGITYSGELFDVVRKAAHGSRVPLAAAQKIHDDVLGYMLDGIKNLEATGARSKTDLDKALRDKWKGDYDAKSENAKRMMQGYGIGVDDASELERMIGSPRMLDMFASIFEKAGGEASLPNIGGGGGAGMPTNMAATQAELDKLHGDPAFLKVLNDPRHPENKAFKEKRQKLLNHLSAQRDRAGAAAA